MEAITVLTRHFYRSAVTVAVLAFGPVGSSAELPTDVCVFGGTFGGVVPAVQAARMGKQGSWSNPVGISAVDIGDPRSIGGITREYFTRLVAA